MTTIVTIDMGGTGATHAAGAREALSVPSMTDMGQSYAQANAAYGQANAAYGQANTARSDANTTFSTVNTTFATINTNYQAAYAQANTARDTANNAYNNSNTKLSTSGGSISGDLAITGNLTVQGNATTINVSNLSVNDSMILLSTNAVGDSNDIGFIGHFDRGPTATHAGLIRKATENRFYLFDNYEVEPSNNVIDVAGNNFTVGNLRLGIINANSYVTSAGMDVTGQANAAYGQANAAYGQANTAYGQANAAYGQANAAYGQANAAYGDANTRVLKAGDTMTGQLNISSGGLLVTGNVGVGTATPRSNVQFGSSTYTGAGPADNFRVSSGTNTWISADYNGLFAYFGALTDGTVKWAGYNYASGNNVDMVLGQSSLYIKSNGDVSIGTASPNYSASSRGLLYVNGTTTALIGLGYGGTAGGYFYTDSSSTVLWSEGSRNFTVGTASGGPLIFTTNNTERIRITSTGTVGVGTATPETNILVVKSSTTTSYTGTSYTGASLALCLKANSTSTGDIAGIRFINSNASIEGVFGYLQTGSGTADFVFQGYGNASSYTEKMRITGTGNVGIGTTNPSYKLDAYAPSSGINIGGSNSRLYFGGNRAVEGSQDGATVQFGEGYTTTLLYGTVRPNTDNAVNLGTSSFRWANIYTADLNLSNRDSSNDIDGTWGEWTIQEGEEDLFLLNRRNGKKYKFMLKEIE